MFVREHLNSVLGFIGCVFDGVVEVVFFVELYFLFRSASFIAVQTETSARQLVARGIIIVILGVVQLVGVHTDFACGSMIKGCVDSGIVGILEINTILVFSSSRTACSIDSGFVVQVCSVGDRNSSAFIQIWYTGLDILNAQCEGLRTVRCTCIVSSIDHL